MSVLKRFKLIFGAKANKLADKAENPAEALDYAHEQISDKLRDAKGSLVSVVAVKKRHEATLIAGQKEVENLNAQVKQAVQQGNDELAERIIQSRDIAANRLAPVKQAYDSVAENQKKLEATIKTLQHKLDAFATEKETLKANYAAAEASDQINQIATGIGEDAADIGLMIERAKTKTEQLQARSAGMDELMESGVLKDFGSAPGDEFAAELAAGGSVSAQNEIAAMKAEMGLLPAPPAPIELETGLTTKTEEVK